MPGRLHVTLMLLVYLYASTSESCSSPDSMAILLLLVYKVLAQLIVVDAYPILHERESPPADPHPHRTTWIIIRSCLATIFSCAWAAVHLNIPQPEGSWYIALRRRLWVTMYALMAPEFVLAWAGRQYLAAGAVALENQALLDGKEKETLMREQGTLSSIYAEEVSTKGTSINSEAMQEWDAVAESQEIPSVCSTNGIEKPRKGIFLSIGYWSGFLTPKCTSAEWTRTHGFFVAMGGFHLYKGDAPLHPLSRDDIKLLIENSNVVVPTQRELQDKSKGDAISKGVVIVQTLWFLIQCAARIVQHLPITQLELITIAYTTVIAIMYWCWWDKPLSVMCPVKVYDEMGVLAQKERDVFSKPSPVGTGLLGQFHKGTSWGSRGKALINNFVGMHDETVDLSKQRQIPLFYAGKPTMDQILGGDYIALAVATLFGGIHCLAWSFPFLSFAEKILWRVAAIICTGVPLALGIGALILFPVFGSEKVHNFSQRRPIVALLPAGLMLLYLGARVVLLVVAGTSLRSLPTAAYESVYWADLIPHV